MKVFLIMHDCEYVAEAVYFTRAEAEEALAAYPMSLPDSEVVERELHAPAHSELLGFCAQFYEEEMGDLGSLARKAARERGVNV